MEKYIDLFNPSFLNTKDIRPVFPKETSLAMVYAPLQEELTTYSYEEGLKNGTIFPALNKEFCGRMVMKIEK